MQYGGNAWSRSDIYTYISRETLVSTVLWVGCCIHVRPYRRFFFDPSIDSALGHSHFHGVSSVLPVEGPMLSRPEIVRAAAGLHFDPQRILRPLPRGVRT